MFCTKEIYKPFSSSSLPHMKSSLNFIRIKAMNRMPRNIHKQIWKIYPIIDCLPSDIQKLQTRKKIWFFHRNIFYPQGNISINKRALNLHSREHFLFSMFQDLQDICRLKLTHHLGNPMILFNWIRIDRIELNRSTKMPSQIRPISQTFIINFQNCSI